MSSLIDRVHVLSTRASLQGPKICAGHFERFLDKQRPFKLAERHLPQLVTSRMPDQGI